MFLWTFTGILKISHDYVLYFGLSYLKKRIYLLNYPNNKKKVYFLGIIKDKEEDNNILKDNVTLRMPLLKF